MVNVSFSPQSTGACPECRKRPACDILDGMCDSIGKTCSPLSDATMEIVVYRCPEFTEMD